VSSQIASGSEPLTDDETSFDNPEYVKRFRETVKERILLYQKDSPEISKGEAYTILIAERHYPDDIEKQLDFHVCVNVIVKEAEKLGYTDGHAPTPLVHQIAIKYKVNGAFIIESIYAR